MIQACKTYPSGLVHHIVHWSFALAVEKEPEYSE